MRRIWKRGWIILLVGVLLIAGGLTVWAQGAANGERNGNQAAWPGRGGPAVQCDLSTEQMQALTEKEREILASKLGLSVEELQSACGPRGYFPGLAKANADPETWRGAMQDARQEALKAAVEDGTLTQEQADCLAQLKAPMAGGRMAFRAPNMPLYDWLDIPADVWRETQHTALANALGMTTDDLTAALNEGKTVRELMEEKDLTVEEVQKALQAAFEDAVKQAQAEGRITAAQAEKLLKLQVGGVPGFGKGGFGGQPMPMMRGRGGMMRGGFWPKTTPTPTTSS